METKLLRLPATVPEVISGTRSHFGGTGCRLIYPAPILCIAVGYVKVKAQPASRDGYEIRQIMDGIGAGLAPRREESAKIPVSPDLLSYFTLFSMQRFQLIGIFVELKSRTLGKADSSTLEEGSLRIE